MPTDSKPNFESKQLRPITGQAHNSHAAGHIVQKQYTCNTIIVDWICKTPFTASEVSSLSFGPSLSPTPPARGAPTRQDYSGSAKSEAAYANP